MAEGLNRRNFLKSIGLAGAVGLMGVEVMKEGKDIACKPVAKEKEEKKEDRLENDIVAQTLKNECEDHAAFEDLYLVEKENKFRNLFNGNRTIAEKYFRELGDNDFRSDAKKLILKYCAQFDVPFDIAVGVMGVESGGKKLALNQGSGAAGLFQLMARTAREELGLKVPDYNYKEGERKWIDEKNDERADIEKNIYGGVKLLRNYHRMFGRWGLTLAAYNWGPGHLARLLNKFGHIKDSKKFKADEIKNVDIVSLYQKASKEIVGLKYPFWIAGIHEITNSAMNGEPLNKYFEKPKEYASK